MGIFFPCANGIGALVGAIIATGLNVWIFVGRTMLKPDVFYELPTSTCGCANVTSLICDGFSWNVTEIGTSPFEGLNKIYSVSTIMFSLIGAVSVVVVGVIVSLATGGSSAYRTKPQLIFWTSYKALKMTTVERVESYQYSRGT